MGSARTCIDRTAPPTKPPKVFNRAGPTTVVEKALVHQFVADQPRAITQGQVTALSKVLRRSREAVKSMIEEAREDLASNIKDYVTIHKQAMQDALANGDPKSLEVATRAAQWGMENISLEGVRVVDKAKTEDTGIRIQIGVKVGGVNDPTAAVRIAKVTPLPETLSEPLTTTPGWGSSTPPGGGGPNNAVSGETVGGESVE